jgi:acetolactate synthase-1/2/3 large subunit
MGTSLTSHLLSESDLVVAVGNSLNAVSTARWTKAMPPTIVQIDIEPTIIGRNYPDRTIGVVGDAERVLCQLQEALGPVGGIEREHQDWVKEMQARKQAFLASVQAWPKDHPSPPGRVHPIDLITTVREETENDAMLVVEAGNAGVWSHLWEVRQIDRYMKPVGFGNMGFAVPASVASKLLLAESQVIVLVGDGSLGMTLAEIETLVRERLNVCIVVLNDGGYGNIRQEQIYFFGKKGIGVDFGPMDYSLIARACGLLGVSAQSNDELRQALRTFRQQPQPTLIDVQLDGEPNVWTFPLLAN